MKGVLFFVVAIIGLIAISSCEPVAIEEDIKTRSIVDTTQTDSLPPGYVSLGVVILNTNWDADTVINFGEKNTK